MPIKYDKIDKWFIKKCFGDFITPIKYDVHGGSTFFVEIGENDDRKRQLSVYLGGGAIEELEKRYRFCSVHVSERGLRLLLERDRWLDCEKCGNNLWYDQMVPRAILQHRRVNFLKKPHKTVCPQCYKKASKEKRDD